MKLKIYDEKTGQTIYKKKFDKAEFRKLDFKRILRKLE